MKVFIGVSALRNGENWKENRKDRNGRRQLNRRQKERERKQTFPVTCLNSNIAQYATLPKWERKKKKASSSVLKLPPMKICKPLPHSFYKFLSKFQSTCWLCFWSTLPVFYPVIRVSGLTFMHKFILLEALGLRKMECLAKNQSKHVQNCTFLHFFF